MEGRLIGVLLIHGTALALGLTTIALAGQPIYANDTWVHLALGEQFALHGPHLANDPHLFAAAGPPSPSSWLGSLALFEVQSFFGFLGLRVFHAAWVALILILAWGVLARVSASRKAASAGLVLFILLATYRVVQLRPELFTMAATLGLFLLLIPRRAGPRAGEIAAAAMLAAVWSNVHAAFLLGPLLILGVSLSLFAIGCLPGVSAAPEDRKRATRLGLAGGIMLIASGLNPEGWKAHLVYFAAGGETLALGAVADEWWPTNLLAAPLPNLPPTWAAWVVAWLCVLAIAFGTWRMISELRTGTRPSERSVDPALLALAVAGVLAALIASRFLWLGIFAVGLGAAILVHHSNRLRRENGGALPLALLGLGVVALCGLHLVAGDWVLVSRGFRSATASYGEPYYASKFQGHAVWFLADSQVEGQIYNDYPLGGFMSFWLSPRLKMASSGTMNVAREAMEANLAIANRQRVREDEDFLNLLDRQGIDLFLGTGLPVEALAGRRNPSTVHHLEGAAGWIPIFRSLKAAVYLRDSRRNAENLARVVDYYERAGVPFDPESGFDPEKAIAHATEWSISHGIIPSDFAPLIASVRKAVAARRVTYGMHRAAKVYATLGLYDRALEIDRRILAINPADLQALHRQIWSLLRMHRYDEALVLASAAASESAVGTSSWRSTVEELIKADPRDRSTVAPFPPSLHV